jgi:hypothetical protein
MDEPDERQAAIARFAEHWNRLGRVTIRKGVTRR